MSIERGIDRKFLALKPKIGYPFGRFHFRLIGMIGTAYSPIHPFSEETT